MNSTPRLFIQENLTRHNRELLRETKERAKAKNYAYVWHTNGKILVRKTVGVHAIHIKCNYDLDNL